MSSASATTTTTTTTKASVIGAGLAGSLLAVYLRRRGYEVDVFEKMNDSRTLSDALAGRSINLVLTSRGLDALREVGLEDLSLIHI